MAWSDGPSSALDGIHPLRVPLTRDDSLTLRELLETLKCFGVTLALHDGDTVTVEPLEMLTPAVRAALTEHQAALVALIRSGPASTSSFDTLLIGLDGLGARPPAEVLQERLRTLADGPAGADPLVRELVRAEAIARLTTLGVRHPRANRRCGPECTLRPPGRCRIRAGSGLH